jgi:arginyl-tRNA synthetase
VKEKIDQLIKGAISSADEAGDLHLRNRIIDKFYVEPTKNSDFGDFASTIALVLASPARENPRDVALIIKKHVRDDEGIIEKIEIAGPGYLNFFLKPGEGLRPFARRGRA